MTAPYPLPNLGAPSAVVPISNYTTVSASGTTTVKSGAGVYFGYHAITAGTSPTAFALDGTSTLDGTTTITGAGQTVAPGAAGVGVRFETSLVFVQAGASPCTLNVLWD